MPSALPLQVHPRAKMLGPKRPLCDLMSHCFQSVYVCEYACREHSCVAPMASVVCLEHADARACRILRDET